ncbi:hypothetical protein ADL35_12210 [Streptomyces sp. NRRL WC-3753]|nr:hypothetical protein ADL35_12210 [Streptomyces sp. NRRL WC-3753]
MPSTFTGLVLLVVALLPGLAYTAVRERGRSERRVSVFRETGAMVFASAVSDLTVLGVFAVVRTVWPSATPDTGRLVREGGGYAQAHYAQLALWGVGLLAVACVLAAVAGRWAPGRPHPAVMSAWWVLFEHWHPGKRDHLGCLLEDGSYIEGVRASFNTSSEDSPDRDLVLVQPIRYRPPGAAEARPYDADAVCVSARRIVAMFVSYLPAREEPAAGAGGPGVPVPPVGPSVSVPASRPRPVS